MTHQPTHQNGEIVNGRYRIIQFIGHGQFGETYLVEDIQLPGSNRLLKYLSYQTRDPATLETVRRLFKREAETLYRLGNHNQIPQLYDYFEENQKLYLVEEYIEGSNLQELHRTHIFNETEVINILCKVLSVLHYLSQNDVIHRDIKPENLMKRKSDGKIFLVDFGAVKQVGNLTLNAQGQPNPTIIGTPGYMPEEQANGDPRYASDIHALGITAIQLLTGRNAIELRTDSQNEVIEKNLHQFNPPHLARILTKMVHRIPATRYPTANDVLADLKPLTLLNQTLKERYTIISYLGGGGGFSHTYFAEDPQNIVHSQRRCIVKQFHLTNNPPIFHEVGNRLGTALESLPNHQQISRLFDHFQHEDKLYLVYQFIEGENLNDQITAGKLFSETDVFAFLKDVLKVLSSIHQEGIIHGDIKPSNLIQRQQDNKFVLIDFSEFKQIFNLSVNNGKIVVKPGGSDGYMPFEQMQNPPKPCSDIYALGMTAIQALTGVHPQQLPTNSHNEVIWQNQTKISPKLANILTKMVRFNSGNRYQSAQEVLDVINGGTKPKSLIENFLEWLKNNKPLLIILGVSSIGIAGFISWRINSSEFKANNLLVSCEGAIKNQKYDKAIQICDESIKTFGLPKAHIFKGIALQNTGKNQEAIASYDEAIKLDPKSIDAWANKGYIYNNNQQFEKGLSSCEAATTIDPNSSKGWLCLGIAQQGIAQQGSKQYDNSITSFDKTIDLACGVNNPDAYNCALSWFNKGDSLKLTSENLLKSKTLDKAKAIEILNKAIQAFDHAIDKGKENEINTDHFSAKKDEAQKLLNEQR